MINKWLVVGNATAKEKAELLQLKLAPKQGKLGVLGLITGTWMIVAFVLFAVA